MTAVIRIPTVLRQAMGGLAVLDTDATTIGGVLKQITDAYSTKMEHCTAS